MSTSGRSDEIDGLRREIRRIYHDIKNPVAIIAGNAELMREIVKGMDVGEEILLSVNDIIEASGLLSDRVDQLKEISRSGTD